MQRNPRRSQCLGPAPPLHSGGRKWCQRCRAWFRGKGLNWVLRRRVPDAFCPIIGKGEHWGSYGLVTYADAKARHPEEMAKAEQAFAEPGQWLERQHGEGHHRPTDGEKRRPFTLDELKLIFARPLYMGCADDRNGYAKPGPNRPRRARFTFRRGRGGICGPARCLPMPRSRASCSAHSWTALNR